MSTHTSTDKGAEAERAAFEAWYGENYTKHMPRVTEGRFAGEYVNSDTQAIWRAWEERARRAPAPVADGLPPLPVTVPEWDFAAGAVEAGQGSPLDIFVYHNEPAGDSDEAHFRAQLQAALDYAIAADRQARASAGAAGKSPETRMDAGFGPSASVPAAGAVQQPVAVGVKDHEIRELVNTLRDIAVKYHGTQQLRSQIQDVVLPMFQRAQLARQSQGVPVYQAQLNGDDWMDIAADKVARWKGLEFKVRTLYTAPQAGAAPAPGNTPGPALMRQAVASVVSRVGNELRVGWLRPERCDVGTLLYCAAEPVIKGATDGAEG